MRAIFALLLLILTAGTANAQGACAEIYQGDVLTPGQWLHCFQLKQDALGYQPVNRNGDTMVGRLKTAPPGAVTAGFNVPPSTAPVAPADGDVWTTTTGLFGRVNGLTYKLTWPPGRVLATALALNFNASGDNAIAVSLPAGFTRYRVNGVFITNASHTLVTATAGVFSLASGAGVAIVTGSSAITVATSTDAALNNAQSMTVNNSGAITYTLSGQPNLYFRVATPEGATATADVTIELVPVP